MPLMWVLHWRKDGVIARSSLKTCPTPSFHCTQVTSRYHKIYNTQFCIITLFFSVNFFTYTNPKPYGEEKKKFQFLSLAAPRKMVLLPVKSSFKDCLVFCSYWVSKKLSNVSDFVTKMIPGWGTSANVIFT